MAWYLAVRDFATSLAPFIRHLIKSCRFLHTIDRKSLIRSDFYLRKHHIYDLIRGAERPILISSLYNRSLEKVFGERVSN